MFVQNAKILVKFIIGNYKKHSENSIFQYKILNLNSSNDSHIMSRLFREKITETFILVRRSTIKEMNGASSSFRPATGTSERLGCPRMAVRVYPRLTQKFDS